MALWIMILRKMAKNKWLQLNLWFGLTVCVALFSSMPLYSEAILQRTLIKELELVQSQSRTYPGFIRISTSVSSSTMDEKTTAAIARADRYVQGIPERMGLAALSFYQQRFTQRMKVYGADASVQEKQSQKTAGAFKALSDVEKRVRLIDGRMPKVRQDGIFEALVTQKFLISAKRDLTEELVVESPQGERFRVIPVGIIDTDPAADPYLPFLATEVSDGFIIPFAQFEKEFTQGGKARVSDLEWRLALNYNQLTVDHVDSYLEASKDIKRYFRGRLGVDEVNIPASDTVASYAGKQQKLDVMMLSLYSPVMLMLAFYLYMAANLVIDRQKTEISVLRSRGASRLQIMASFTVESLLLGGSALAVGPFAGVWFTKLLGASNGFLTFVQRSALEVTLTSTAYKVAALAVAGAILLILIPAFMATRVTIVGHKQRMARLAAMSIWHKTGLDLVLVGLAVYLLYNFNNRQADLKRLALEQDALQIDPLLFLMPALFALGGGLLVLRIYPWCIRLIFWAGRSLWPPALYNTLIQISRSSGQYLTIKVFLIMTVSTGLFSANAARTINDNMESKIQYDIGADIALTTRWENDAPAPVYAGGAQQTQTDLGLAETRRTQYTEPPFQPFRELEGVESAARVFKKDARFTAGSEKNSGGATLFGIDTAEFGRTAWMKNGLLEYPINSYLNLIAPNPKAVLISRSLAEEAKVAPGDPISLAWDGLDEAQFTVYGIIDYWPSWNPLPARGQDEAAESAKPHLVVGHLDAIQNRLAVEPYEVWLKVQEGASSQLIYDQLADNKLRVTGLSDARAELIASKNDPFRLAINGVMTLGFVISMSISFMGFLLFWILNLSGRTLQYGVLRAMGIPFPQMIGMLLSEQLLTSGAAVLTGVMIGNLTSELFVPLFELSFATTEQVPPFTIVYHLADYVQLYSIVGLTLLIGMLILAYRLSQMRITQALKLGEE
ncbi:putative ABC transport system permease protein [Paenibacillus phyllosphaerae]|uniref:Putative ABC transport system permease protein n=1 Tax=Paenibacillus phyllosphaerae TaxID=274593 RepID=A0A7W5ASW2_9BACL|nr:ABC transporter permease [Paenibacillus phyllosphaerae]MBB3108037.1 putative ABC transport system permease protein [Paenibacillus phyllosphaerae]